MANPDYLVLVGATHRLAVQRTEHGYVLEAWSPSSLTDPHNAEIVLTDGERERLVEFLSGHPAR